jgi:putative NADH-flavin reductase
MEESGGAAVVRVAGPGDPRHVLLGPAGDRSDRLLGEDQLLVDENGNSEISAEDYAIAIADLLEQGAHPRSRVAVGW